MWIRKRSHALHVVAHLVACGAHVAHYGSPMFSPPGTPPPGLSRAIDERGLDKGFPDQRMKCCPSDIDRPASTCWTHWFR